MTGRPVPRTPQLCRNGRRSRDEHGAAVLILLAAIGAVGLLGLLLVVLIAAPFAAILGGAPDELCAKSPAQQAQTVGATPNVPPVVRGTAIRLTSTFDRAPNVHDYMVAVMKSLAMGAGRPETDVNTPEHLIAFVAWGWAEGGGIKGNYGRFNVLNTSLMASDLRGVKVAGGATVDYPSFDIGVEATARTIEGRLQSRIRAVLLNPASTAEQVISAITYWQNYPGNACWACPGGAPYYQSMMRMTTLVRANYFKYGGEPLRARGEPPVAATTPNAPPSAPPPGTTTTVPTDPNAPPPEVDERLRALSTRDTQTLSVECDKRGRALKLAAPPDPNTNGGGTGTPPPVTGTDGAAAVLSARRYLGYHYQWGGGRGSGQINPATAGMDCSGFMITAYRDIGISLPKLGGYTSQTQAGIGQKIGTDIALALPGDLVVVNGGGHVGMYTGKGPDGRHMWIESSGGSRCTGPSNWYSCRGVIEVPFKSQIVSINRVICGKDANGNWIICR